uniref:Uncharacterized protein n=1 Tax=Rhizophora mucronata TaxID=61149 RepID=A0A2P2QYV3_RHIMU
MNLTTEKKEKFEYCFRSGGVCFQVSGLKKDKRRPSNE